jgi:hypothetical protein
MAIALASIQLLKPIKAWIVPTYHFMQNALDDLLTVLAIGHHDHTVPLFRKAYGPSLIAAIVSPMPE